MLKISIYIYWHKCSRFVLPTDERTKVFQEVLADLKSGLGKHPSPRIQLSIRPFVPILHASYIVIMMARVTWPQRPKDEV